MKYTVVYWGFCICSDWIKFHAEFTFLKKIFRKSGYPENFFDKCFIKLLGNIHLIKEKVPTVERKHLLLVLPYLGVIELQTRTKLQQAIKGVLNWCKLEIAFKCQTKLSNSLWFKDPIPKDLFLDLFINFSVASVLSPIYIRSITTYWKEGQTNQKQCCSWSFTSLQLFTFFW